MRPAPASRARELQASNPGRARSGGQLAQGSGTWRYRPPGSGHQGPGCSAPVPCPAAPSPLPRQWSQGGADLPAKLRTAREKPAPVFSCLQLRVSVAEGAESAGELEGLGPSGRRQEPGWSGVLGKSKRSHRPCAPLTWPNGSHRGKSWVSESWLPPSARVGALDWELFHLGGAVSLHVPWGDETPKSLRSLHPVLLPKTRSSSSQSASASPRCLSIPPGSASQVQGAAGPACALWFVSPAGCKLALRVPAPLPAFSAALCEV